MSLKFKKLNGGGYKNVVSLGFFCGPSQEFERIGYRSFSLPFDWLITEDFSVVINLIESHFDGFLTEENLQQEKDVNPKYYYDTVQKIHFYHDFSASEHLSEQLTRVKNKYARRIERFYDIISKPCLFIRYCQNEDEYSWIKDHFECVNNLLKGYNSNNDIVFVCNGNETKNINNPLSDRTVYVTPDANDFVNRHFLNASTTLLDFINKSVHIGLIQRTCNYYRYYKKRLGKSRDRRRKQ